MDDMSEEDYARAVAEGARLRQVEPRAAAVHYAGRAGTSVIAWRNGAVFSFPARLGQGLEAASANELADVSIDGDGYGLHWEALDVDLAVPALLMGHFGSDNHMRRLASASARRDAPQRV